MDLQDYRQQIDGIDDELCRLFVQRMQIVDLVGEYKRANNQPVNSSAREREVLTRVSKAMPPALEDFGRALYRSMFDISKASGWNIKNTLLHRLSGNDKEIESIMGNKPQRSEYRERKK